MPFSHSESADQIARRRLSPLMDRLRCVLCGAGIEIAALTEDGAYPELGPDGRLRCSCCGQEYPLIAGTPRMLEGAALEHLRDQYPLARAAFGEGGTSPITPSSRARNEEAQLKQRTADSFAYEWEQFGKLREQWAMNFRDYMQPHAPESLEGRLLLDVGAGSGRHSHQATEVGAEVVAVDLGRSIDIARRNLPPSALTVQADAERLPFEPGSFDFVMSIGVLHHLPDPPRALRAITRLARPGGNVHVYLYWVPEQAVHRAMLRLVTRVRRLTIRLPHRLLHLLCYPLSVLLFVSAVLPHRLLRRRSRGRPLARRLPLKTYADYPFGVLVNDQFDRFSAPIEHRYTREEVEAALERVGLRKVVVVANHGWVGDGQVPDRAEAGA